VAEDGGSSSSVGGMLQKKYGGVPLYIYLAIGVLGLALVLKTKKKTAATTEDTSTAGSSAASTSPNLTPQAGLMPWSSDVFVNSTKQDEAVIPQTVMISEATDLNDFVAKMNAAYKGLNLTPEAFRQMNPTLAVIRANSRGYLSATNPDRGDSDPNKMVINVGPSPNSSATVRIR